MATASAHLHDRLDAITEQALAGDIEGAVRNARALLSDAPESGDAWLTLAMILSSAARWPEAHDAFARAVERGAKTAAGYRAWARTLEKLERLDQAAEALRHAHALSPDEAAPLHDLGAVLYRRGDYEEALETLGRAQARAPEDARIAYALGLCEEASRRPAAAVAAYQRATALDPKLTAARKTLADLLASLGEHEQAIAVLDELLRIERSNEQAAHNRDVLARALAEMRARRLLGKGEREWELSAVVHEGELKKREARVRAAQGGTVVRYRNALAEVHVILDPAGRAERSTLVLLDAAKAARKRDQTFKVTIVAANGKNATVDYGTAISLTFLREGLGIPMTQASRVYARALSGGPALVVGGARVTFTTLTATGSDLPESEGGHGLDIALER